MIRRPVSPLRSISRRLIAAPLAFAAALSAVAAFSPAPSAAQQGEWINPDVIALRDEVARLQAEVAAMRGGGGGGALGGATGGAVSGDGFYRLSQIEAELRTLTGRIEELEFRLTQGQLQQSRQIENLRFRLDAIEGVSPGAGLGGDPLAAPGLGNGVNLATGGAGAQGGAVAGGQAGDLGVDLGVDLGGEQTATLNQGGAPLDGQNGGVALDATPGLGAPPQVLGTIPGDDAGAAVPQAGGQVAGGQIAGGQTVGGQVGTGQLAGAGAVAAAGGQYGGQTGGQAALGDSREVYQRAVDTLRAGDFLNARSQLKTFIAAYPADPLAGDANYWLGETFYVRGQYDEAARAFAKGVKDYPDARKAPDNLMKLGMTLAQLGESGQACLTFSEVPARYPNADQNVLRRTEIEARRAGCR